MKEEQNLQEQQEQALNIPVVSNCTCGKEKRYCKGCLCDVTETMYCYCGEFPLTKESTYTDADLKDMNVQLLTIDKSKIDNRKKR